MAESYKIVGIKGWIMPIERLILNIKFLNIVISWRKIKGLLGLTFQR